VSEKSPEEDTTHNINVVLANIRMIPEILPNHQSNATIMQTSVDDSSLDGSRDVCSGGTYLPIKERDEHVDENNNPEYMEADGNYDEFLVSIQF
jgi:hypothetical protein